MAHEPGYYIVRGPDDPPGGHLERLSAPMHEGYVWNWHDFGPAPIDLSDELPGRHPRGEIVAGPFTMADISDALLYAGWRQMQEAKCSTGDTDG